METFCKFFNSSIFTVIAFIGRLHSSQFDIRERHTCRKDDKIQLISLSKYLGTIAEAKCVAVNPKRSEMLAIGANDVYARLYDRRMLKLNHVS